MVLCFRRRLCVLRIFIVNCRFSNVCYTFILHVYKPMYTIQQTPLKQLLHNFIFLHCAHSILHYLYATNWSSKLIYVCSIAVDVCLIPCLPNMGMCMVVIDGILLQVCSQEAAVPWTFYLERSSLFFFCSSSGTSGMYVALLCLCVFTHIYTAALNAHGPSSCFLNMANLQTPHVHPLYYTGPTYLSQDCMLTTLPGSIPRMACKSPFLTPQFMLTVTHHTEVSSMHKAWEHSCCHVLQLMILGLWG